MLSVKFLQYDTIRDDIFTCSEKLKKSQLNLVHGTKNGKNQGVALTGRNTTGPPWSVGRPTARAHGRRPAGPPAGSVTDDDRRQRTKQY